ncbi:acyl-CoA ligase (AMP-forming), exosortase A system-associated [Pseudonocardia alni]|uniref:acyl-CoA ligase (AMP-forming), exosortase A system-associated n=1 Tax=Pseudonocardia alni TaxID=33907 RepID=UPI002797D0C0|nr:acyl-CoA ligase (AMP-forming), exosortase A system-associated [Pseudonocardia alni]
MPDSPAVTVGDTTVGYGWLGERVESAARGLLREGLARHDRVAVYLDKRLETVIAIFAVSAAGGVVVPINPLARARQVLHVLEDCTATMLITTPERTSTIGSQLGELKALRTVLLVDSAADAVVDPTVAVQPWSSLVDGPAASGPPAQPTDVESDMAAILYTSGSTGLPKGVVLSHRNLVVGADSVGRYLAVSPSDRILAALPLSFDAGLSQLTSSFLVGAHVVLVNYLLSSDIVRLCAEHRITGLTGVPPLWIQLAEQQWPAAATESMRFFANTGGRMPRTTLQRLRALFPGAAPYLMYGLTEAFRSTYLDPGEVDRRPDSIGRAIPNAEVMVVREDGTPCAPDEPGELVHRGPLVTLGYWNDPVRTAERFRPVPGRSTELCVTELAVWSGDMVVRDEHGFLYFVGRNDDMIKTSGYRVSPAEVEEVAYETGVVRDAVAIGLEDPRLGQRIVLVVTPRPDVELDEAVLRSHLRSSLPLFANPKQVVVRAEIPRSPNGKFDRVALRGALEDPTRENVDFEEPGP